MPSSSKTHDKSHTSNQYQRALKGGANQAFFEGIQTKQNPCSAPRAEHGSFFPPNFSQPHSSSRENRDNTDLQTEPAVENDTGTYVQPKLNIRKPGDKYEGEADTIADIVADKAPSVPESKLPVQRQTEKEETVQKNPLADDISRLPTDKKSGDTAQRLPSFLSPSELEQNSANGAEVQTKRRAGAIPLKDTSVQRQEEDEVQTSHTAEPGTESKSPDFEQNLHATKGKGKALSSDTKQQMESGFGADFSGVRTHTGPDAVQMNRDIGAQAFTHGNDIYFDEGKYQPGTKGGDRLLAHELTHTIQQGASGAKSDNTLQSKPANDAGTVQRQPTPADKPVTSQQLTPVSVASKFEPNQLMATFLDENHRRWVEVPVTIPKLAEGKIKVRQRRRAKEGTPAKYQIRSRQGLPFSGLDFLNPLRAEGIEPVIALETQNPESISGFVSLRIGRRILPNPKRVIREVNKHLELLGLLGVEPLKVPSYENKVENGVLTFRTGELKTTVAGYIDATGSFGLVGETFTFKLDAGVDIKGLAQGSFTIEREANGKFNGQGEIAVAIANLSGKVVATYTAGDITIQGSVGIESEKFSGEVNILVADKQTADKTMRAELGVESLAEEQQEAPSPQKAKKKTKRNQVVAGWGQVKATITPWLEGTANIGVDSEGHVTIVGKIGVPDQVELMEQKDKEISLFELEIKAGYGVPLVGQIGFFASIRMFINAGFGPLVLRDVGFEGTYSTDPSVLQNFKISGTLGISAFAIIGLEAKAGVFVTLIGHDIKAGIKVTAAAGIRAYVEVTPTFEYTESKSPQGGKVGEAWLRGHFEAAAQLFLKLAGSFFVELDSPWWSPAPDKTWDWPLGDVEYPIGPSMGIGGNVDWLVGSSDVPELKFSPVEFDADKFTSDIMADPPPGKGGGKGGEQKGDGKWEDNAKKGGKEDQPEVKEGGKGLEGKKREDLTKLPEQQRYMRALGEIGDLGDAAKQKPITYSVLDAKVKRIKRKYALQQVSIREKEDSSAKVFVKQGKYDNSKNMIEVRLMSEAERQKLVQEAIKDLEAKQDSKVDPKAQTIKETDAKAIATEVAGKYEVVETIIVVDNKDTWDYVLDLGDKKESVKGKKKASGDTDIFTKENNDAKFTIGGTSEEHTIYVDELGNIPQLIIESTPTALENFLNTYENKYKGQLSRIRLNKISAARSFIQNEIIPLVQQIENAQNKEPLLAILLKKNSQLGLILKEALPRDLDISAIKEKYALEGQVGQYSAMPEVVGDDFEADHQPANSIFEWIATLPYFAMGTAGAQVRARAAGRSNIAFAINLQHDRHAAGRTYGTKAIRILKDFQDDVDGATRSLTDDQSKRNVVIDLLKGVLNDDANFILTVYSRDHKTDKVWSDVRKLNLPLVDQEKLVNEIRDRVRSGEAQMKQQPLDRLKK